MASVRAGDAAGNQPTGTPMGARVASPRCPILPRCACTLRQKSRRPQASDYSPGRVPRHRGYSEHPQKIRPVAPPRLAVRDTISLLHVGQCGASTTATDPATGPGVPAVFPACFPCTKRRTKLSSHLSATTRRLPSAKPTIPARISAGTAKVQSCLMNGASGSAILGFEADTMPG